MPEGLEVSAPEQISGAERNNVPTVVGCTRMRTTVHCGAVRCIIKQSCCE